MINEDYERICGGALPSLSSCRPQAKAICPFHEDDTPSLSVNMEKGLFRCFGCGASGNATQFQARLMVKQQGQPASVPPRGRTSTPNAVILATGKETPGARRIIRSHRWVDEQGIVAYKHRLEPKSFMWTQDVEGKLFGKGACIPTLYELEDLKQVQCVIVTEGERDADTVNGFIRELHVQDDLHATCTPNGAGDVKPQLLTRLHGKVIVWVSGDNDPPGNQYREQVKVHLRRKVREIRTLVVPSGFKDWSEWAEVGGTAQQFRELLKAAPIDEPLPLVIDDGPPSVSPAKPAELVMVPQLLTPKIVTWSPPDMAEQFLDVRTYRINDELRLRKHNGSWLRYDGKVYQPLELDELQADIMRYVQQTPDRSRATETTLRNIIKNLEAHCLMPASVSLPAVEESGVWREAPHHVVVLNGIVRLTFPPTLEPHSPRFVSRIILPFDYDPQATCPGWNAFLDQVLPDEDSRLFLQEWFGYCLTPGNRYQKFLMLEGPGGNGKGICTNILTRLLHDSNVSNVPLNKFNSPHELVGIDGKLANICTELKQADKVAEDRIKEIVGGDKVHFNPKYKQPYSAKATAKLILSTNERPAFTDRSHGMSRRLTILPFPVTIPPEHQNPRLEEWLAMEMPGILNWAIAGAVRLETNGRFTESESSRRAQEEFWLDANHARAFLLEHYEAAPRTEMLATDVLYTEYGNDCTEGGFGKLNRTNFFKEVERVFPQVMKGRGANRPGHSRPRILKGIRRRAPCDDESDGLTLVISPGADQ
jgi:putative DNA primase/helicase